ncbi:MAG: hypothetical protein RLZZ416_29 [Candidatus Parcubacteria bacterium]|jgi:hypothetical protein
MNYERAILVGFLGNYLVNTVVAAIVALIPSGGATGTLTPQYISFVVLAVIVVAGLTWWNGSKGWKNGAIFGAVGFLVAIATAFVTGVAGVLAQTGSFSSVAAVLPNFWPFLWNVSTLVLLGYWIIPAAAIGWWGESKMKPMSGAPM